MSYIVVKLNKKHWKPLLDLLRQQKVAVNPNDTEIVKQCIFGMYSFFFHKKKDQLSSYDMVLAYEGKTRNNMALEFLNRYHGFLEDNSVINDTLIYK